MATAQLRISYVTTSSLNLLNNYENMGPHPHPHSSLGTSRDENPTGQGGGLVFKLHKVCIGAARLLLVNCNDNKKGYVTLQLGHPSVDSASGG